MTPINVELGGWVEDDKNVEHSSTPFIGGDIQNPLALSTVMKGFRQQQRSRWLEGNKSRKATGVIVERK